MLIADILHSCSDEGVAAAAVASVGGLFAAAVRAEAERVGVSVGSLTASLVAGFARDASERDWRDLSAALQGADLPVLSGVQLMAEHGLRRRERATRLRPSRGAAAATHPAGFAFPALSRCPA